MNTRISSLLLALGLALANVRCTTDDMTGHRDSSEPPRLPSAASLAIPELGPDGAAKRSASQTGGLHFAAAAASYLFWTGVAGVTIAGPAWVLERALETRPIPLPDSSGWQWLVEHGGSTAVLTSRAQGDRVDWSLLFTRGTEKPFLWLTGTAAHDGRSGNWIIHDPDENPKYGIVYDLGGSSEFIKATVLDEDDQGAGSYLEWTAESHLRSFEIHDAVKGDTLRIDYNTVTEAGRLVKVREGNSYCWADKWNGHKDIACSELKW